MGRIFGIVNWGSDAAPGVLLDRMFAVIEDPAGAAGPFVHSLHDQVAFGAIPYSDNPETGISENEDNSIIVSYCGTFPGLSAKNGTGRELIYFYERAGTDFLEMIPGSFMLALFDAKKEKLLLASDRNGRFPIYYSMQHSMFLFSSSIAPIVDLSRTVQIDRSSIMEHFLFYSSYGSRTIYKDIKILGYGCCLEFDMRRKELTPGHYFRYEDLFDIGEYRRNRHIDASAELDRRMKDSVRCIIGGLDRGRTGLSCGGGIDCSYIGALLAEEASGVPMFCTSVEGGEVAEDMLAESSAGALGVQIHLKQLTQADFYPLLIRSILQFGQPVVHPNITKSFINIDQVIEQGRPHQLLGVASDLLFGGYYNTEPFYRYLKVRNLLLRIPAKARKVFSSLLKKPEVIDIELRMRNPLEALRAAGMGNLERAAMQGRVDKALSAIRDPGERALKRLMIENLCDYQQHLLNRRYELTVGSGASYHYPFLDVEVVRFAMNLPVDSCVKWGSSKIVVRKAASSHLGSVLSQREKWAGGIPLEPWVSPLAFLLEQSAFGEVMNIDFGPLMNVIGTDSGLLWCLIDLELWFRLCFLKVPPGRLLEEMRAKGITC